MNKEKYCTCHTKLIKIEVKEGKCTRCGKMVKPNHLKQLDAYKKNRQTWKINPETKVHKNKKKYNRNKEKQKWQKRMEKELNEW